MEELRINSQVHLTHLIHRNFIEINHEILMQSYLIFSSNFSVSKPRNNECSDITDKMFIIISKQRNICLLLDFLRNLQLD